MKQQCIHKKLDSYLQNEVLNVMCLVLFSNETSTRIPLDTPGKTTPVPVLSLLLEYLSTSAGELQQFFLFSKSQTCWFWCSKHGTNVNIVNVQNIRQFPHTDIWYIYIYIYIYTYIHIYIYMPHDPNTIYGFIIIARSFDKTLRRINDP